MTTNTYPYCYFGPCINARVDGELYCTQHEADYWVPCTCAGCVRARSMEWDPTVPHCTEETMSYKVLITDGSALETGGHTQCLQPLNADGTCPNAHNHHSVWVAKHFRPASEPRRVSMDDILDAVVLDPRPNPDDL